MPRPWNKGLRQPLSFRLWQKVQVGEEEDGCWEFTGAWRSRFGYGRIREGGQDSRCLQAHIAMYEMKVGPLPVGSWLRHQCDNPGCVNPAHLVPGSAADNLHDQYEHGAYSERARQRRSVAIERSAEAPAMRAEIA